jgi:hypothetical protein
MIVTLNAKGDFIPGTFIMNKQKGIYAIVLSLYEAGDPVRTYKCKSLNLSKHGIVRKFQLWIIKKAFKY